MSEKLVLIDGLSILNRAFFGIPDLTNSDGIHTNAIYGFLNILFKILDEEKPEYLTVAFDVSAPTFRHEMFVEYKGTRKPMAEELRQQIPLIKEMLLSMNICLIEKSGYEADDLIGTIARIGEEEELAVSVVSGDRDLLQLATDKVKIRIPKTKKTGTEIEDYYASDVVDKYGVTPLEFIDMKALMGDASDNIPGVPGIGEKTASSIISQFHSIENAYAHLEEIKPNRAKQNLGDFYEQAKLSKVLATIEVHAKIDYQVSEARVTDFYTQEAYLLCKKYEFKNMLGRFEISAPAQDVEKYFQVLTSLSDVEELFQSLAGVKEIGLSLLTDQNNIYGVSICYGETKTFAIPIGGFIVASYLKDKLSDLFHSEADISTMELKPLIKFLNLSELEIQKKEKCFDCSVASYLLNATQNAYNYEDIAKDYLSMMIPSKEDLIGKKGYEAGFETDVQKWTLSLCYPSYVAYMARKKLLKQMEEEEQLSLYRDIEQPLIFTLADMETAGISVDREELKIYGEALTKQIELLQRQIYEHAGEEFNINSPKQLGVILFEKISLPYGKKTKSGYSTAADVLEKLSLEHPIVSLILEYRTLAKLKSTYADGLAPFIGEDGRIHSNFQQTIASTGRLSSTDPNLQNIPIRLELGRRIRKVFKPKEGCIFVDADYSQIELRVLAHMSGDQKLIMAYQEDKDIHRITASQVFHIAFDEVTDLQRRNAKAVNFGIVYGISSFGLSQDLSISRKDAADYIERYFETYPSIKSFLDGLVQAAKNTGYSETMFHRRRPLPEINSSNFMQRSFGERVAMNAPIQGTAADIIKLAMIAVDRRLKEEGLKSRLILQVHDELLIEAEQHELEQIKKILEEEMTNAVHLSVRLEIDMHTGMNWYEAK
ncbi:MAG: DNA polymerase I [Lachnospiraceae bacterium]